ncbi:MAG: hypothetical protein AAF611_20155 [Bacteroidota bacterium]
MREKKKSLKLRKFKIASLDAAWLKGGTNSFPCNNTQQGTGTGQTNGCPTVDDHTCPEPTCNPDTRTKPQTQPANPCTCTTNPEGNGGLR